MRELRLIGDGEGAAPWVSRTIGAGVLLEGPAVEGFRNHKQTAPRGNALGFYAGLQDESPRVPVDADEEF